MLVIELHMQILILTMFIFRSSGSEEELKLWFFAVVDW